MRIAIVTGASSGMGREFVIQLEKCMKTIDEICSNLDQSLKRIKEEKMITTEELFNDLCEEFEFPIDEEDKYQDMLKNEIHEAEFIYSRYCQWRERSRILLSMGYPVPTYEEVEKQYREKNG